ncbi:hypothetical protein [Parasynechococcus marenigrum]|uniref:2OG-Fe(II) oxygenase n=1 Tax=Parasynechococcus marenigrum (strain WH8102) TaxID=84588 RepID=Q7U928_PARMW|nr:hypothetical protein [Parasynechococcus marenigrum]CAE06946.1 hypothetical [Parasynechococcus marenigrum WH 8102]
MTMSSFSKEHLSILSSSPSIQVSHDPFPHVIIRNCLSSEIYNQLESSYPSDSFLQNWQPERTGENVRQKVEFHSILQKDACWEGAEIWREFVSLHLSNYFFQQVLDLFRKEILTTSPLLETLLGCSIEKARISTHIPDIPLSKKDEEKTIFLEGDVGINTPLSLPTSVRGPHVDGMQKIFAGLLYFRRSCDLSSGGDLELSSWRYNQQPIFRGTMSVNSKHVVTRCTIPYAANTAILWVNSPNAIHSVTPRSPSKHSRRLVYFSGRVGTQHVFKQGLFPLATRKSFVEKVVAKSKYIVRKKFLR